MHLRNEKPINNHSSVSQFLLLEFSEVRELQILHALLFLVLYLATVTGNLIIISAVVLDYRLHTPMYFFLMNLAIFDLGSISVIVPKSMANSLFNMRLISYSGCIAQVFFSLLFTTSDIYFLTVMAYDRYVAICNPLQYEMVMNRQRCLELVAAAWFGGLLNGGLHASGTFAVPFCSNVVNQFFCEIPQLLKLICSGASPFESGVIALGAAFNIGCSIFIIVSYLRIFTVVLRMPSVQGRRKAFSTCLPHLIVFSMFVVTGSCAYLRPPSNAPSHLDLAFSMIYSLVPPLLNPVIYSMRNRDIKCALSKLLGEESEHSPCLPVMENGTVVFGNVIGIRSLHKGRSRVHEVATVSIYPTNEESPDVTVITFGFEEEELSKCPEKQQWCYTVIYITNMKHEKVVGEEISSGSEDIDEENIRDDNCQMTSCTCGNSLFYTMVKSPGALKLKVCPPLV
ncbi:olfactory receptor 14J1-like [Tiliqua scincoides]|uniref:olfactory receptor 14J1-like n=1 Tax=Tiliqua scincoides TaxID=71010 RepID=UPI003462CDAE